MARDPLAFPHTIYVSPWVRPMRARDPRESHRTATTLELLYDLCFVVAIAFAATQLHEGLAEAHFAQSVVAYVMVFFAIWWAWMNFTWFASAYDTDDVPYRLKVFVQVAGVLILAAGVPSGFAAQDFRVIAIGYCVMRLGLVAQWLRAARADADHRPTALRYAAGIVAVQAAWVALIFAAPKAWLMPGFLVLVAAELAVPFWGERVATTSWHPGHIAERYGLLTLIVIGESVLSTTAAVQAAVERSALSPELVGIAIGGLMIFYSMWWVYFSAPEEHFLNSDLIGYRWGYGHYVIFASTAAVGAGLAVVAHHATHHDGHLTYWQAGLTVAVPLSLFVLSVWLIHLQYFRCSRLLTVGFGLAPIPLLLAGLTHHPVPIFGLVMATLVAMTTWLTARDCRPAFEAERTQATEPGV